VRLRRSVLRPEGPEPESAGLQDCGFQARARSPDRSGAGHRCRDLPAEGMNVKALTSALLVAVIARSFAETIPSPGPSDSRIRVAAYSQVAVYRLSGFVGFVTDVEV